LAPPVEFAALAATLAASQRSATTHVALKLRRRDERPQLADCSLPRCRRKEAPSGPHFFQISGAQKRRVGLKPKPIILGDMLFKVELGGAVVLLLQLEVHPLAMLVIVLLVIRSLASRLPALDGICCSDFDDLQGHLVSRFEVVSLKPD